MMKNCLYLAIIWELKLHLRKTVSHSASVFQWVGPARACVLLVTVTVISVDSFCRDKRGGGGAAEELHMCRDGRSSRASNEPSRRLREVLHSWRRPLLDPLLESSTGCFHICYIA